MAVDQLDETETTADIQPQTISLGQTFSIGPGSSETNYIEYITVNGKRVQGRQPVVIQPEDDITIEGKNLAVYDDIGIVLDESQPARHIHRPAQSKEKSVEFKFPKYPEENFKFWFVLKSFRPGVGPVILEQRFVFNLHKETKEEKEIKETAKKKQKEAEESARAAAGKNSFDLPSAMIQAGGQAISGALGALAADTVTSGASDEKKLNDVVKNWSKINRPQNIDQETGDSFSTDNQYSSDGDFAGQAPSRLEVDTALSGIERATIEREAVTGGQTTTAEIGVENVQQSGSVEISGSGRVSGGGSVTTEARIENVRETSGGDGEISGSVSVSGSSSVGGSAGVSSTTNISGQSQSSSQTTVNQTVSGNTGGSSGTVSVSDQQTTTESVSGSAGGQPGEQSQGSVSVKASASGAVSAGGVTASQGNQQSVGAKGTASARPQAAAQTNGKIQAGVSGGQGGPARQGNSGQIRVSGSPSAQSSVNSGSSSARQAGVGGVVSGGAAAGISETGENATGSKMQSTAAAPQKSPAVPMPSKNDQQAVNKSAEPSEELLSQKLNSTDVSTNQPDFLKDLNKRSEEFEAQISGLKKAGSPDGNEKNSRRLQDIKRGQFPKGSAGLAGGFGAALEAVDSTGAGIPGSQIGGLTDAPFAQDSLQESPEELIEGQEPENAEAGPTGQPGAAAPRSAVRAMPPPLPPSPKGPRPLPPKAQGVQPPVSQNSEEPTEQSANPRTAQPSADKKSADKIKPVVEEVNKVVNAFLMDGVVWVWASAVPSFGLAVILGAIAGDFLWAFKKKLVKRALRFVPGWLEGKEMDAGFTEAQKAQGFQNIREQPLSSYVSEETIANQIKINLQVKVNIVLMNMAVAVLLFSVVLLIYVVIFSMCKTLPGLAAQYFGADGGLCKQVTTATFSVGTASPFGGGDSGGAGASDNWGSLGSGKCQPAASGPASVANLSSTCFGSNATQASAISFAESGGREEIPSSVDKCADGSVVSWGLFQINISAQQVGGLNCPSAFDKMYTGPGTQCRVINQSLYNACVAAATSAATNVQAACRISSNGTKWNAWGANRKCGF